MEQHAIQDNTPWDTGQCWKKFQEVLSSIGKTSRDVKKMLKGLRGAWQYWKNIECQEDTEAT